MRLNYKLESTIANHYFQLFELYFYDEELNEVGYIDFSVYKEIFNHDIHKNKGSLFHAFDYLGKEVLFPNIKEDVISNVIYINIIYIKDEFKNKKYSAEMYKIFNQVYLDKFSKFSICRKFSSPIAEYVIANLAKQGLVSDKLYDQNFIRRSYKSKNDIKLWNYFLEKMKVTS